MNQAEIIKQGEAEIWDFLQSHGQVTRAEVANYCDARPYVCDRYINRLIENGQLTVVGKDGNTEILRPTRSDEQEQEAVLQKFIQTQPKFTRAQMMDLPNVSRIAAKRLFSRLNRAGNLHQVGHNGRAPVYSLLSNKELQSVANDKRLTPEGMIWTAIRVARQFEAIDLHAVLVSSDRQFEIAEIEKYCKKLAEAGYLRAMRKARNGKHFARYLLIRNTGPLPPLFKRVQVAIDENEDRVVYVKGANLS